MTALQFWSVNPNEKTVGVKMSENCSHSQFLRAFNLKKFGYEGCLPNTVSAEIAESVAATLNEWKNRFA